MNTLTIHPQYRVPLLVSLAFHLCLLFLFLFLSPHGKQYRAASRGESKPVVQAVAVSDQAVTKAMHALTHAKQARQRVADRALKKAKAQRRHVQHQLAVQRAKAKREALLLKKTTQERVKVAARLAKTKAAEKRALLRKKVEKKRLAEKALTLQKALEKKRLAGEKTALHQANQRGIFDAYRARIIHQIESHWVLPAYVDSHASCQLLVHLAPGGKVTAVSVSRSSGSHALDRSARLAVIQASPLPVPSDPVTFKSFETLRLTLKPETLHHT